MGFLRPVAFAPNLQLLEVEMDSKNPGKKMGCLGSRGERWRWIFIGDSLI